jgi:hypothetical protein
LIEAAPGPGLKHKAALSVAYGAGLRGCEVVMLGFGNLAVILPISGRISPSTIAGIPCVGEARAAFRSSGVRRASSYTLS